MFFSFKHTKQSHALVAFTRGWVWMSVAHILMLLPLSCTNDAPPMGNRVVGRDSLPVMTTYGVSKLITDSGVIRYKVIAEEWRIFDKTTPPRWEFPKGLFLERYDDKFKVDMRFSADSAWLYDQNVWKLHGNVVLDDKTTMSRLRTQELFWNMRTGELASNVHTYLKEPHQEIEGTWFRAVIQNGRPTKYHIKQSRGFMPMNGMGEATAAPTNSQTQSSQNDSTQQPPQHEAPVSKPKSNK